MFRPLWCFLFHKKRLKNYSLGRVRVLICEKCGTVFKL